jgi:hypothetical protein
MSVGHVLSRSGPATAAEQESAAQRGGFDPAVWRVLGQFQYALAVDE